MPERADWWLYPTYLMNWQVLWKAPAPANIVGHFWSLCVEEQFYCLWPIVILALKPRSLLRLLASAEILIVLGRSWWVFHHGANPMLFTATITRMDRLLFGAGCAVAVRQFGFPRWAVRLMPWFSALSMAIFLAAARFGDPRVAYNFILYGEFALLGAGFAALLLYAVLTGSERSWLQTWLRWRPLTRIGKHAYGIYLFHVPVFYFLSELALHLPVSTRTSAWIRYPIMASKFLVSFALAGLSYHYFEKRFLALKGRFEPEHAATPSATPGECIVSSLDLSRS